MPAAKPRNRATPKPALRCHNCGSRGAHCTRTGDRRGRSAGRGSLRSDTRRCRRSLFSIRIHFRSAATPTRYWRNRSPPAVSKRSITSASPAARCAWWSSIPAATATASPSTPEPRWWASASRSSLRGSEVGGKINHGASLPIIEVRTFAPESQEPHLSSGVAQSKHAVVRAVQAVVAMRSYGSRRRVRRALHHDAQSKETS